MATQNGRGCNLQSLQRELKKNADAKQAEILQRFFKTGKGEYGEGDKFLGIKVPVQRTICCNYCALNFEDLQRLLKSKVHEERFCALAILRKQYEKADAAGRKKIFDFYIKNAEKINNWDLVDLSAPYIAGDYLLDKDRKILYKFARSRSLWKRRIAVLSTFAFIRDNDFADTLNICEILLEDKDDLMHKATGWMLREVGKRNLRTEEEFLSRHYRRMPRTMLRYALEKMEKGKRDFYMQK